MISIKSNRLEVKIAEPNKENLTSRFSRAAFITSVVLDGKTEFMDDERGGTGGYGLCSEVKCEAGFDEAAPGEKFMKVGVGHLTKPNDQPYLFMYPYEVDPFEIETEVGEDTAVFTVLPKDLNGYSLKEIKTVKVFDNVVQVNYELTNTGEKPLHYSEYVHNFLSLELEGIQNQFNLEMPVMDKTIPAVWSLKLYLTGHLITGKEYFAPDFYNIWSPGHCISPETFCTLDILPGETVNYKREWIFE